MCVAIFKPKNTVISKEALRFSFLNNNDGAGFAYSCDNKLILQKGFFSFEDFWKAWRIVPQDCPALIHFRKITHGPKNKENCHPWIINENHAMIHNGIITQHKDGEKDLSDTGRFVNKILKPIFAENPNSKAWNEPWMISLLETYLGGGNKMVILSNEGEAKIYRPDYGMWDKGVWFSNDSFKKRSIFSFGDGDYSTKKNSENASCSHTLEKFFPLNGNLGELDDLLEKIDKKRGVGLIDKKKKDSKPEKYVVETTNSNNEPILFESNAPKTIITQHKSTIVYPFKKTITTYAEKLITKKDQIKDFLNNGDE